MDLFLSLFMGLPEEQELLQKDGFWKILCVFLGVLCFWCVQESLDEPGADTELRGVSAPGPILPQHWHLGLLSGRSCRELPTPSLGRMQKLAREWSQITFLSIQTLLRDIFFFSEPGYTGLFAFPIFPKASSLTIPLSPLGLQPSPMMTFSIRAPLEGRGISF